jgi:hypothetical protein
MQMRRFALHKSYNVASPQTRESDSTFAETTFEKIADKRQIINDRCVGQGTRLAPLLLIIGLRALLHLAQLGSFSPLYGDYAATAQKLDELSERRGITCVKSNALTAILQY